MADNTEHKNPATVHVPASPPVATGGLHPAVEGILAHFRTAPHPDASDDAKQLWNDFAEWAEHIALELHRAGPEVAVGLRRLMDSRDSFMRAHTEKQAGEAATFGGKL